MQSANPSSIGGVGGGIPAPQLNMQDGGKSGADLMGNKTNSETIAVVNTNHEGMIVSDSFSKTFLSMVIYLVAFILIERYPIRLLWHKDCIMRLVRNCKDYQNAG